MSIAAGLSLMKKLGAKVASISSPGLSLSSVRSALRAEATSVSIYGLKVDNGDKSGWLVSQAVAGNNPRLTDPNYPSYTDPHYKGSFDTLSRLQSKYPASKCKEGDYAFVLSEVPCMQDTVSNSFLKNSGTGTFVTGQVVSSAEDYTILNYLESTGTQWINTNIPFQANDSIEIEVTPLVKENTTICGAYEDSGKICTLSINNATTSVFIGNDSAAQTPVYTINTTYTLKNTNGQWKYNTTNFGPAKNNTIQYPCALFARNGQTVTSYSKCRIHSYKHTRNGQVILNLRPVNRLADLIRWKWNTTTQSWQQDNYILEEGITFNSKASAQAYISSNNLQYTYPNGVVSTISPVVIEGYVPESSSKVDEMTQQLGPNCLSKNAQCWGSSTPRPGTPIEFTQVIKQKIFSFG